MTDPINPSTQQLTLRGAVSAAVRRFSRDRDRKFAGTGFLASLFFAWFIQALYASSVSDGLGLAVRTFCLLWFASGAAFFVGTIAGFLFGVPKVVAGYTDTALTAKQVNNPQTAPSSAGTTQQESHYRINTNLEDISDWFTKIILGLGLANIGSVVTFVDGAGDATAAAMAQPQGAKVMAISGMVYAFVSGFLIVYIWTRTSLKNEFERVETIAVETK